MTNDRNSEELLRNLELLIGYPVESVERGSGGRGMSGRAASATTQLSQRVSATMREVLGRSARPSDTQSFLAALNRSFSITERDGLSEVVWQPHNFAGQADLGGGITGAQASLVNSASLGLGETLNLLDQLYMMQPDGDPESASSIKAIVRSSLQEIVGELKREGGPLVPRVQQIFVALLARDEALAPPESTDSKTKPKPGKQGAPAQPAENQPEESQRDSATAARSHDKRFEIEIGNLKPFSQLQTLQAEFGLINTSINTIEEELNYSNFLVIRDYAFGLYGSWLVYLKDPHVGLGTDLVKFSRALSVIDDTVYEVLTALDSVNVGQAERLVSYFSFEKKPLNLEDVFNWITIFASEEAPRLVQEGGRRGIREVAAKAYELSRVVDAMVTSTDPNTTHLPTAFRHPRVRNPLIELQRFLRSLSDFRMPVKSDGTSK